MNTYFDADIKNIKGVGTGRARLFEKLGVTDVGALLRLYPRDYLDWSSAGTLAEADLGGTASILARRIGGFTESPIRKGMTLFKCVVYDRNGAPLTLTFFNNPGVKWVIKEEREYIFRGKLELFRGEVTIATPTFHEYDPEASLEPVYPQTEGLSSRIIARTVRDALDGMPADLPDCLPRELRERFVLPDVHKAFEWIHFPADARQLKQARRRFVFEELLLLGLGVLRLRSRPKGEAGRRVEDRSAEYAALLPFELTGAQRRAIKECLGDMTGEKGVMWRLLQGDVGSGKTAVAAALCFCCARAGLQSALMAPTEILAEQHYRTFTGLLGGSGISVGLLTGSVAGKARERLYEEIRTGALDVIIGTHALISQGVEYKELALVITDEQHRFGVAQRAALGEKGEQAHTLVMTATPIPRTLALMTVGDMDISVLDELPKGRLPVLTYHVDSGKRKRAYGFIRKHVAMGEQAFIVCPRVGEGERELASAEEHAAALASGEFADLRVGLLHGRMKPTDKDFIMRRFIAGELDIMVSTTVIEVGVDVPAATVMLIENAECFGLSQLHQLRGRVGRGERQAYCILISDAQGEQNASRMRIMTATCDGFEIAAEDLRLRGPGDFFGARQSGIPTLRIADLSADTRALAAAQAEAARINAEDPMLERPEHAALAAEVARLFRGCPSA